MEEIVEKKKVRLLVYNAQLYKIGGIETFIKNFVKRMKDHFDILYVYESGDAAQLEKIKQHVPIIQYVGQKFDTDICLWVSAWGKRPENNIDAQLYVQMIHADYEQAFKNFGFKYSKLSKVTKHIAVGAESAKAFTRMYGYECDVIHNLLDNEPDRDKVLNLITVSRMGKEKGFDRIVKIATQMKKEGRKFLWHIFGDIPDAAYKNKIMYALKSIPEVIFMPTRLDILPFVANADYLVQLSDTEAFCYSIYEALQMGTPCIVTNFPSAHEVITNGKNGYILEMDLSNLDIDKLYNEIPNQMEFKELSTEKDWIKAFKKIKPKDSYDDSGLFTLESITVNKELAPASAPIITGDKVTLEITRTYRDIMLNRYIMKGEILDLPRARGLYIVEKGYGKLLTKKIEEK